MVAVWQFFTACATYLERLKLQAQNTIRQAGLFQLSAEVNVRVTHRRWLQGHVSNDSIKDCHWVVVHTEDVVNVAQYVGIIPKVVSKPGLSLIP